MKSLSKTEKLLSKINTYFLRIGIRTRTSKLDPDHKTIVLRIRISGDLASCVCGYLSPRALA